jgi:hypothetical protein
MPEDVVNISLQMFLPCFVIFDVFFYSCTVPFPCLIFPGIPVKNGVIDAFLPVF